MIEWLSDQKTLVAWMFVLSIVMFLGTLVVVPILIVRIPPDYFLYRKPPPDSWRGRHPVIRWSARIIKNLLGLVFATVGLVMLLTPGQGVLMILIGVSLLDIPGKRALEQRIVSNRVVLRAINALRARAHRPPLQMPPRGSRGDDEPDGA